MPEKINQKVLIAKVSSVFGIKGEVKIISYCQNPHDVEKYPLYDKNGEKFTLKISNKNKAVIGTTESGAILIAKISLAENRNEAEALRGMEIFTDRKNFAKKLKKNEFYHADLIDLNVVDDSKKKIGKVLAILDFGAGVMIEIKFKSGEVENFPFKNEFFGEVNIEENFIKFFKPEFVEVK